MGKLGIELAVELPVRSRRALDLRVGAGRRERRTDSHDHRLSVQFHPLLLFAAWYLRAAPEIFSPGVDPPLPRCSFMQNANRCHGTSASEVTLGPLRCQRNVR